MPIKKGIILSGGNGTRLYPATHVISKQLLPIYDKPLIYYSISVLMLANIKDILIITNPHNIDSYKSLLKDGSQWGIKIKYQKQEKPNGLAEALILGENFLCNQPCALILGDNIFYGNDLSKILINASKTIENKSTIFAYNVKDPQRYGIVNFNKKLEAISIEEKPNKPKSSFAVTGLYFFDKYASSYAKTIKPSKRGELEITDLNNIYLNKKKLRVQILSRGIAWFDTGTPDSLLDASNYISNLEKRQGLKVSCPEEIAFNKKWIEKKEIQSLTKLYPSSDYIKYLRKLIKE
jgi:glucose-1-phosphate thymidylyltransferase